MSSPDFTSGDSIERGGRKIETATINQETGNSHDSLFLGSACASRADDRASRSRSFGLLLQIIRDLGELSEGGLKVFDDFLRDDIGW